MMGIDIDGLGNHNFDRSADFMRHAADPARRTTRSSRRTSSTRTARRRRSGRRRTTFKFAHGVKIGIVGFSNDDIPSLTKPGALDPFHVANSLDAVNAEAARIAKKMDAVVAIGHLGATAGTLTDPTGPLVDLADAVSNVDVVIGDHTDQQVLTTRPNGVLVTENRSKGLRFTRVRLVDRPGQGGRRLQDGRLPQAVRHRHHARRGDPGEDRRPERAARADLQHGGRQVDGRRSRGPTRVRRRPAASTVVRASRWSATSSPTRSGPRTRPTSRSRTRAACAPT